MSEGYSSFSPMLPTAAQLPAVLILFLLLVAGLRLADTGPARFVVFAIWIRLILSNFHNYTFPKLYAGLSINALSSVALVVLGLLCIRKPSLLAKGIVPLYLFFAIVLLSAALNGNMSAGADVLVKYGYLLVIAVATYDALLCGDRRRFGIALLLAFSPLLLFQLLSVLLGVYKHSVIDQSVAYIGGYNHEAVFSVALVAMFVAASLASGMRRTVRWILLLLVIVGVTLANYRTAILGALPLAAYHFLAMINRRFEPRLRPFVLTVCGIIVAGGVVAALFSVERFADLRSVAAGDTAVIKAPDEFRPDERNFLSGRAKIWSTYIYAWKDGSPLQQLAGFGPDSWEDRFTSYAHNSFVSFLYEYGLLGVAVLLLVIVTGFVMAALADSESRARLLAAHSGFVLLNMATMPLWQIEGLMLYGILWGYTMFAAFARARPDTDTFHPASGVVAANPPAAGLRA
jgi:hypothetical protein